MTGSAILAGVALAQEKSRSAAPAAVKKAGLCAMSTRSLGCNGPLSAVRPGLDTVMLSIASAAACALRAALAAASARAWYGWPPGTNLTAMSVTMSHEPPRSRGWTCPLVVRLMSLVRRPQQVQQRADASGPAEIMDDVEGPAD